jgi:hypothetical protein
LIGEQDGFYIRAMGENQIHETEVGENEKR